MPTDPCQEDSGAPTTRREFVPRRTHRKSRLGCGNCKKRKIKCDESRPSCKNCGSFSIVCDYDPGNPTQVPPHTHASLPRLRRGRPRTRWPAAAPPSGSTAERSAAPTGEDAAQAAFDDLGLAADELALLRHHTATARGQGPGDAWAEQVARVLVPQLGREHRFLMRFVLAFAALHLARLQPGQRARWAAAADQHLAGGLRGVAQVLPALGPANCRAAYVSACFVCFCAFARGPRRGEYLLFADGDDDSGAAFLLLMRGVRQIVEAVGEEAVFSGPLRACPRPERADLPAGRGLHRPPRVEWAGPVGRLRAFVACSADACADAVLRAVDDLARCFGDTCGDGDGAERGARPQEQAILAWLFRISTQDRFVECLRQKRPLALLVLAHFAVLLRMLDHVWFMAG